MTTADGAFLEHRSLLRRLAYDLTGSVHDADDAVQDAYLRWIRADHEAVRDVRAYLVRTVTTAALDILRRRDRTSYVGEWLVEPVATEPAGTDVEEIDFALLQVLHRLSARERAAFLLHDVLAFSHDEIAAVLDVSAVSARQLASRARRRLREDAPAVRPVTPEEERRLLEAFLGVLREGDLPALTSLLAEDARLVADGGGHVTAALRPVVGRDRIERFVGGLVEKFSGRISARAVELNRRPGLLVDLDGELDQAIVLIMEPTEDRDQALIREICVIRNPEKLAHLRG